jgi:hypothetical protein
MGAVEVAVPEEASVVIFGVLLLWVGIDVNGFHIE